MKTAIKNVSEIMDKSIWSDKTHLTAKQLLSKNSWSKHKLCSKHNYLGIIVMLSR